MKDNQHIRDFLAEIKKDIEDLVIKKAAQYDIPEYDVVTLMGTGVYVNDDAQMMVGVTSTTSEEVELQHLLDGMEAVLDNLLEEPEEGTIEWWLKNYGGRDSGLN